MNQYTVFDKSSFSLWQIQVELLTNPKEVSTKFPCKISKIHIQHMKNQQEPPDKAMKIFLNPQPAADTHSFSEIHMQLEKYLHLVSEQSPGSFS